MTQASQCCDLLLGWLRSCSCGPWWLCSPALSLARVPSASGAPSGRWCCCPRTTSASCPGPCVSTCTQGWPALHKLLAWTCTQPASASCTTCAQRLHVHLLHGTGHLPAGDVLGVKYTPCAVCLVQPTTGGLVWQNSASLAMLGSRSRFIALPITQARVAPEPPLDLLQLLFAGCMAELEKLHATVKGGNTYRHRIEVVHPTLRHMIGVRPDLHSPAFRIYCLAAVCEH